MQIRSLALIVCAMVALALMLRLADTMPDLADGVLFGVALGCIFVLSATRSRRRAPR